MEAVNQLLQLAKSRQVSDIYFMPRGDQFEISFRHAAGIEQIQLLSIQTGQRWLNYLKFQAGMNVAEHRRVQAGAYQDSALGLFLRLSSVGNYQGQESLVVRLITGIPPITTQAATLFAHLRRLLNRRGLLTLSGPTGSGKTTLLYQLAQTLVPDQMVMTIEDPVEIYAPAFLQLQVNPLADMTYATLVKAALRHRPDCLIIGEIRDQETAQIACEAAISGHIVLATVHARHPLDVPLRLTGLGVAPALVNAAITATAAVSLAVSPQIHAQVDLWQWEKGVATHDQVSDSA